MGIFIKCKIFPTTNQKWPGISDLLVTGLFPSTTAAAPSTLVRAVPSDVSWSVTVVAWPLVSTTAPLGVTVGAISGQMAFLFAMIACTASFSALLGLVGAVSSKVSSFSTVITLGSCTRVNHFFKFISVLLSLEAYLSPPPSQSSIHFWSNRNCKVLHAIVANLDSFLTS